MPSSDRPLYLPPATRKHKHTHTQSKANGEAVKDGEEAKKESTSEEKEEKPGAKEGAFPGLDLNEERHLERADIASYPGRS